MIKLGFVLLFLAHPLNYFLKYNMDLKDYRADYISTFMMCIGLSFIAYYFGKYLAKSKKEKYLFFYPIAIFNLSLVLIYSIDLLIDPIFHTSKVIWSFIITTFITLCIYLFSQKF